MAIKILIVDDDPDIRDILKLTLSEENYEIFKAGDGEEAMRVIQSKPLDLIMVDYNMPKMNGIDFLAAAKADAELRQIPIIILTVSSNEQDTIKCFDLCAAGYVVKPASYEEFVDIMKTLDSYWTLSELPFTDI